ncbi:hypothetical protein [Nocardia miyunensis]|uniref:hypothetical protein n=1 Tax=Nocardia miyunensis TaxID=282684 RepID=UPI0012F4D644|nr:hypothetical protein [Nocardia miyunensis]
MTKSLSYMPASERDRMALGDCATPPDSEITTAQAHLLRSLHAGHPFTCVRRLVRSREENGSRHEIPYAPLSSASGVVAGIESVPVSTRVGTI